MKYLAMLLVVGLVACGEFITTNEYSSPMDANTYEDWEKAQLVVYEKCGNTLKDRTDIVSWEACIIIGIYPECYKKTSYDLNAFTRGSIDYNAENVKAEWTELPDGDKDKFWLEMKPCLESESERIAKMREGE